MPPSAVERLTAHAAALGVTVTATEFPLTPDALVAAAGARVVDVTDQDDR